MKTLLFLLALALIRTCYGQGSVNFANNLATRVYYTTPEGSTTFIPAGSQFTAELMFAPDGTPPDQFNSVAVRAGATTGFGLGPVSVPGIFNGGGRTVANISPEGGWGLFQVRVWETAAGSSYAAAVATDDSQWRAGKSEILRVDTGNPTGLPGNPTPLTAYGLTSFTATPVPEPSTIALGLLAAGALFLLRRRKRSSDL